MYYQEKAILVVFLELESAWRRLLLADEDRLKSLSPFQLRVFGCFQPTPPLQLLEYPLESVQQILSMGSPKWDTQKKTENSLIEYESFKNEKFLRASKWAPQFGVPKEGYLFDSTC